MIFGTALCVSGWLIALLYSSIVGRRERLAFEGRFPAISDEEFVERCAPGTRPEVALLVRKTVSDALGVDYERVYPSSRLMADLGAA